MLADTARVTNVRIIIIIIIIILWGKLCEMFIILTSVDATFSIR